MDWGATEQLNMIMWLDSLDETTHAVPFSSWHCREVSMLGVIGIQK